MTRLAGQPRVGEPPPGLPDCLIRRLVQQELDRAHRGSLPAITGTVPADRGHPVGQVPHPNGRRGAATASGSAATGGISSAPVRMPAPDGRLPAMAHATPHRLFLTRPFAAQHTTPPALAVPRQDGTASAGRG
ncbi:hypothetical protein GCM10017668_01690 [Streptomyces tuirus]|uniref:Uncharacterized protein n=1 Tax=Streptomyces tuirus TaxID=68278 RepID=A0A7G1N960_9ACTN|nr:hypothetical protein GCM10017668_01690 [Streptomyces tuirus]